MKRMVLKEGAQLGIKRIWFMICLITSTSLILKGKLPFNTGRSFILQAEATRALGPDLLGLQRMASLPMVAVVKPTVLTGAEVPDQAQEERQP